MDGTVAGLERLSSRPRENTPWLFRYAHLFEPGARVLDLGCGTGDDTLELHSYGCAVIALDLDPQRVRLVPSETTALRIAGDTVHGLPFQSETFDHVVASLSLHYFTADDTDKALAEIWRILCPSGALLARVNAVGDVNFGFGEGDVIEPLLFRQPDGRLKRFFDPPMLKRFLEPCFRLEHSAPRRILQGGIEKQTLECLAWKR